MKNTAPLFVDLDGTLIKGDMLFESAMRLLKTNIFYVFMMCFWLLVGGKARLKHEIAGKTFVSPDLLPYNIPFLDWLTEQKQSGRDVILASASTLSQVQPIADYLGLFNGVLATTDAINLAGENKLKAIQAHIHGQAFDYAGNAAPDLKIWAAARNAIIVSNDASLIAQAKKLCEVTEVFAAPQGGLIVALKAMRVYQWLKNALLGIPLFTAHKVFDVEAWKILIPAFIAFGLVASATYLLNDMLDLDNDRKHPRKRTRPFASGELSIPFGVGLMMFLFVSGFLIALLSSPQFLFVLIAYLVLTLSYSLHFKSFMLVDVLCLAGLYTLRIVAGGIAINVAISNWLLGFSTFIFFSLALVKRCAELEMLSVSEKEAANGRDYRVSDLPTFTAMGVTSGYLAVLIFALYIDSLQVTQNYSHPKILWLVCPLMLYWISRLWVKTARGEMHDDPLVYSLRDNASRGFVLSLFVLVALAI